MHHVRLRKQAAPDEPVHPDATSAARQRAIAAAVKRAARYKTVLQLRGDGARYREIGQTLGVQKQRAKLIDLQAALARERAPHQNGQVVRPDTPLDA